MDEMEALDQATSRYRQTEAAHEDARQQAMRAVVAALKADKRPTDVVDRSPFTAAYVRRIAREAGIEPAKPGPKKKVAAPAPVAAVAPIRPATKKSRPAVVSPPKVDPGPGPVMSDERAAVLAALAYERASDTQRAGLDQTGHSTSPAYRDFAVVAAAQAWGLLSTAELHHVDEDTEETED